MVWKIVFGVAGVLVVLVVGFLITAALQPSKFKITRSIAMKAPPSAPFELINDFHQWRKWSPWEDLDPNLQRTYMGPEAGIGSQYGWSGNGNAGEGLMTIIESKPGEQVLITIEFKRPMVSTANGEFDMKTENGLTTVVWTMTGEHGFMGKAFGLLMNMDKLIGANFEQGLAKLKNEAEKKAAVDSQI